METLTDVVYPIGSGSGWKNNELRFSLRSVEKYGINTGKIFVVGLKPGYLSGEIIHIPANDIYNPKINADGNIIHKVLAACKDERLSENFLFINDDHLLLKPIDLKEMPNFHKGDLNSYPEKYWKLNYWRGRLKQTKESLNQHGLPALHYDCHTPILFNKWRFPEVMNKFNYQEGCGLTMKSIYGNSIYARNNRLLNGEKKTVFSPYTEQMINERMAGCMLMSFNDTGLNQALKIWLYKHFPEKSRWETTEAEDRTLEILKWMDNGRKYREGVVLFEKYCKVVNLVYLFKGGESEYLRKKLEYKLIQALGDQWKK
jgi:hypothetical protein